MGQRDFLAAPFFFLFGAILCMSRREFCLELARFLRLILVEVREGLLKMDPAQLAKQCSVSLGETSAM
jgi:hypothetical protein